MVKGQGQERKCKYRFCKCLRENRIDLHKTNTEVIFNQFYTYRRIHFILIARNA